MVCKHWHWVGVVCADYFLDSRLVGKKISHPISVHTLGPNLVPTVCCYITEPRPPSRVLRRAAGLFGVLRGVSSALGVRQVSVRAYCKPPENTVEDHETVP